jgi:hypothetical protein
VGGVPRERVGAVVAEAHHHARERVAHRRLRRAADAGDVGAEHREHGRHLVLLEAERTEPRLHGDDAVVGIALGDAA